MKNSNNFKCNLNNNNKSSPIKSLFEIEAFLRNLCNIKKSVGFAKRAKSFLNSKNKGGHF